MYIVKENIYVEKIISFPVVSLQDILKKTEKY